MTKAYKISIVYFLVFSLLLLCSGIFLFEEKIGFSIENISEYYIGNEGKFIPSKTTQGIAKIMLPHSLAFALLCMVLLHFLVFTQHKKHKKITYLVYLIFVSAFFEIISPFFIAQHELFSYLKIISFILFELLIFYTIWLIFYSIIYK